MAELTLVIGNKSYSSWSLRPWLLLKQAGIPFREIYIPTHTPQTRAAPDHAAMRVANSGVSSGSTSSSKATPAWRSSSHGRSDHEE